MYYKLIFRFPYGNKSILYMTNFLQLLDVNCPLHLFNVHVSSIKIKRDLMLNFQKYFFRK